MNDFKLKERYYLGYLITLEGPDGGGKTTLAKEIGEHLTKQGVERLVLREPGGTAISEKVREILKSKENSRMEPITETLLFQAARAQLCREVIIPALMERKVVILDRFRDSSLAYQGVARKMGKDVIDRLNDLSTGGLMPDKTILLDLEAESGISRIKDAANDRLDSECMSFHCQVRNAFLGMAREDKSNRWIIVDASRPLDEVKREVLNIVDNELISAGFLERRNLGKERF